VLRHHRVEVAEHLGLVLAVEAEVARQAALEVVLADGEGGVRADLGPAEIPHAKAERDVGDLVPVLDVQRRRVRAGGGAERHVHEDVEGRRAPGDALPGAEVARHERVGVRAAVRAEVRRRRGDVDVVHAVELGVRGIADQRAAVGAPAEGRGVIAAAAQADLHALIFVAGGVDRDLLRRARLGRGEGAPHRRYHPDGGLRRAHPREQQDGGQGDDGEAGGRETARPGGESAGLGRRRLRRPAGAAVHAGSSGADCTSRIGQNPFELRGPRTCSGRRGPGRARTSPERGRGRSPQAPAPSADQRLSRVPLRSWSSTCGSPSR